MAKISIIIPVYNVKKFLNKCLKSIVNQTFTDLEIICINDGSTDKSLSILNSFAQKDNRIIVINQSNQGQSCARNAGLAIATGEYTGFVDSDDWIDLDFYEKLYTAAEKYNADIVCVNDDINTTSANGKMISRIMMSVSQNEIERTSERTKVGL